MSDAFRLRFQAALGGAYALDRELSGGGMSRVFLGRDLMLGRQVVLKVLPPDAATQEPSARFRREAMLVARLQHPHILPVFGVGVVDDIQYFTMPYVEGGTLRTHLEQHRHLPVVDARRVLCEIGDALACAHRQGIVHRDVKPENIFLEQRTGRALLADFGVAFALGEPDGVTQAGTTVGTPAYMSPEQVDGRPLDGLSDIYSLGLVGWEMVTGQRPWSGDSVYDVMYKQKHESLRSLDSFNIEIAPSFVRAIDRALLKDPKERWPSAEAFVAALDPDHDHRYAIYPGAGWSAPAAQPRDLAAVDLDEADVGDADVVADVDAPTIVAQQHQPFEFPQRQRPSGATGAMDSQEYEYRARVGWRSSMYGARDERRAERGRSARVMSVAAVVLVIAGAVAGATTAGRRFLMAPFSTATVASESAAGTHAEGEVADIGKQQPADVVSTLTAPAPSTLSVAGTAVAAPVVKIVPRVAEATVSHDSPQSHRGRRAYADARPGLSVRARVATAELQLRAYERLMAHESAAAGQQSTPAPALQPVVRAPAVPAPATSAPAASVPVSNAPVSSAPAANTLPASAPAVSPPAVSPPAVSAPAASAPAVSTPRVSVPAAAPPAVASPVPPPTPSSDPPLAPAIPTTSGESPSAPPSGVSGNTGSSALVVASGPAKAVRVRGAALTPGSGLGNGVPVSSATCRPAFPGSHVCRVYDAHTGQVVGYQFVPGGTPAQSR